MTRPFPDNVFLTGFAAPSGIECDAPDLIVEGELPDDLLGSYYRNGPDPLHPPRAGDVYHWFHGDGMIQYVHFAGGRVSWRNRWVRTQKYELERAAGESLFGVLGNPMLADPAVANVEYNTANTHIVYHHHKLLALMEGAPPVEIAQHSLQTLGDVSFDGKTSGPFTAHPKFDHKNGEMIFFGYQAKGFGSREVSYGIVDRSGKLRQYDMVEAPFAAMMHDFYVTENWVVFPVFPLTFSIERAIGGSIPLAWEPELGSRLGVMPRYGKPSDVRWIEHDARFSFHMFNAWEEAGKILIDVSAADASAFAPQVNGKLTTDSTASFLRRWTIDPQAGTLHEAQVDDLYCEFPRIDDRYMTRSYRHGFSGFSDSGTPEFNGVVHYDRLTGQRRLWRTPQHYTIGEPVMVPRAGASAEADGYLLVFGFDKTTRLSELLIIPALDIEQGPVARVKFPLRIPAGFHGTWVES